MSGVKLTRAKLAGADLGADPHDTPVDARTRADDAAVADQAVPELDAVGP